MLSAVVGLFSSFERCVTKLCITIMKYLRQANFLRKSGLFSSVLVVESPKLCSPIGSDSGKDFMTDGSMAREYLKRNDHISKQGPGSGFYELSFSITLLHAWRSVSPSQGTLHDLLRSSHQAPPLKGPASSQHHHTGY
jgi:hypothetical protein